MVFIVFPIHFILQLVTVSFFAASIILIAIPKFLLPITTIRNRLNLMLDWCVSHYGITAVFWIQLFNKPVWEYKSEGEPNKNSWYLLISNHISYLDIILILNWYHQHIPAPKFFIKKELFWMPLIGQAAWALDMPFMQRYSRDQIKKNPNLQKKDIETTRKYCEKYRNTPTTVINFVEGTRFTVEKQQRKGGEFNHLLPPKAGGIAFTLASMGELFDNIVDVTLQYPDNQGHVMMDMLKGKLKRVVMHVRLIPLDKDMIGDYFGDPEFKRQFQKNLNEFWLEKDHAIVSLLEKQK